MNRLPMRFTLLALLLLMALGGTASADSSKLDARTRVALARLQAGTPIAQLLESAAAVGEQGDLDVFVLGPVSRGELEAAGARVRTQLPGIFTAFIPVSALDQVAALPGVTGIRGAAPVELEHDLSVPTTNVSGQRGAGPNFTGLNGAGVIIGDVDSGISYRHDDFKNPDGTTRLLNIWDQSDNIGPNPAGFAYGSEWFPSDINSLAARQVDTDGHGTHVMGSAGGDGSAAGPGGAAAFTYAGMAPKADLIMVKTTFATTAVADGVNYVFQRATALGKNAVCNLSLGSHYGPKDGSSAFESSLTAMSGPGRIVVKSAGNERAQARHAEVFAAGAGTNATMSISGSANGRLVAISGYYNGTEAIDVRITTPGGTVIGPLTLGGINAPYPGQSTTNGNVYLENGATLYPSGAREIYIEIAATASTGAGSMNGTWTFTFIPVTLGAANGEVDLWRFFNSSGTTANFVTGNTPTRELISEPGNSHGVITVASWTSKRYWTDCGNRTLINFTGAVNPGPISPFSSPGPTRDGRQKPDIAAPGSAIASARTVDVTSTCPTSASTLLPGLAHVMNQGTSMAAPHASGAAALLLQRFGAVTPAFIKNYLNANAVVDGNTGAVPNIDWGGGKLFLGDLVVPVATVVSPNGGEVLTPGQSINWQWNASDAFGGVTSVDLYLSRAGFGGPFEVIALGQPNTGSYLGVVTGPGTLNAIFRVVASDAAGNSATDESDAVFTIDQSTPTLLAMFQADSRERGVELRWRFGDPGQSPAVAIERAEGSQGPWSAISPERSRDGETEVALDHAVEAGTTYWYRLNVREADGRAQTFGPILVRAGEALTAFALGVVPNPTPGPTRVDFTVPSESRVSVAVLDVQGREVEQLVDAVHRPGRYQAVWSGQLRGRTAAPGLYFVRLEAAGKSLVQRVVVTR